jgi:electron transfer flavoprotein alpha subunit
MVLVFAERSDDELFRQALTFAASIDDALQAVGIEDPGGYSPDGWATALAQAVQERGPSAVVAPGTDRGNEVLAHVAAQLDLPMAANCTSVTPGDPLMLTRIRWGGSLLEEARLHGSPALLTVAPHAVSAATA